MNRFGPDAVKPITNRFGDAAVETDTLPPTPALDQFAGQVQAQKDVQAHNLLQGELAARQQGQSLVKLPTADDGTTTYMPQQTSAGGPVDFNQKAALSQAYQQEYAGRTQTLTPEQQDALIKQQSLQTNTPVENFGGAFGQTFGNVRAGLVKTYDPAAGNAMAEDFQNTYSSDPNSNAAIAGRVAAGVTMAAAAPAAPLTTALVFGAQTFGDVRGEVAARRAAGQVITPTQEFTAAGGMALATFLASKLGAGYNQRVAQSLLFQNAALRAEGASVIANTIKQYALSSGVGLSDMTVMTLANNIIARNTYDPERAISEGVGEAALVGGLSGPVGLAVHGGAAGAVKPAAPITENAVREATPTPEQMQAVTTAPPAEAVNNTPAPTPTETPSSLATAKTKFRIQDGAKSRGVEIQFEDPIDKALYVATQPRKGKLQAEATKYLEAQGYDQDAIENYGDEVRGRADEAAKGFTGDVLTLPKAQSADAAVEGSGPAGSNENVQANKSGVQPGEVNNEGVSKRLAPLAENAENPEGNGQTGREGQPEANKRVEPGNEAANGGATGNVLARPEEGSGQGEVKQSVQPSDEGITHLPSKEDEETATKAAGSLVKNFKRVAPKTKDHAEAAKVFAKRGVKVVFFEGEGRGFRMKRHPGVLFVNADRNKGASAFREAISHEFIHELHDTRPGLFHELAEAVGPENRAKWEKWYSEEFGKMRPGEKPHAIHEEGVTTPIGKLASSNERVWTAAMGKDPTLLQKIGDFARPFLAKFSSKSRQIQAAVKAFEATLKNPIGDTKHTKEYASATFLPSERVRNEAEEYAKSAGLPYKHAPADLRINPARSKQIAEWYDKVKHEPNNPEVKASYEAMKRETLAQYKFLESKGIKLEPWTQAGQPYESSKDMLHDAQDNKHLYFFTGGEMPSDHPLAEKAPGTDLTYNDVFRAVHDYFGHAKEGTSFGPKGEENAWASHMQMYSPEARPAMTAETRGQNSWVNFGPHGEANRANPAETKYAEQKAAIAPEEFLKNNREHIQEAGKALESTLRKQTGQEKLAAVRDEAKALSEKQDKQLAERPNFLPGSKFIDKDVKPAIEKMAEGFKSAWEGVKSLVAPFTRSEGAKKAALIIREKRGAELAQRLDRLHEAFDKAEKLVDKLPVDQQRDITDKAERGLKQTNPALQPIADAIRTIYNDRAKQVQALGTGKLAVLIKDYMGHLYEKPAAAAKTLVGLASKRPLQGDKGFLKARKIPFQSDAIAAGLKPITDNPVSMMMLKVHQMDKFITAHQTFNEMKSAGLMKKIRARDVMKMQAKGYEKIDDNIATIFAKPSRRGAVQVAGYWMAPETVANVVNNYLSPGLSSSKLFGAAFRGYRALGNTMNQVQLGLSFFHGAFVSYDSAVSSFALGLKNLAKGRVLTGGRQIGEALTLVGPSIRAWRNGDLIMKEWRSPGSTTPEIATLVDAMKAGGGRINMDAAHATNWRSSLKKAWKEGNVLGSMFRLPGAAIETMASPILEKMVPKIKAGVFFEMAQHELKNLGPSPDRMAVREAMSKAWDSVDNRMGELVYDNLFWHKTVKDLAMASTRSVGWNLGTLREVGGGLLDIGRNVASGTVGRGRNLEFSHRAAYTVALPLMTGILGAIIHKAMTGEDPKELKDYYFPKTGQKDKDGHDVRLTLPSYMKDVFAYAADPTATLAHKTHPMVNTIMEMLSNKDYYGTKIRNEDDPIVKQALDLAKHAGEGFVPFGAKEVKKLYEEGQGAKSLLPLVGITQARKDITNSKAELMASKLAGDSIPPGNRTSEDAERQQLVRELANNLKAKQPGAMDAIKTALKEGKIPESAIATIKDHLLHSSFERTVKHLNVEDAMKVWDVATPEEKRSMAPFLFPHAIHAENIAPEKKKAILERLARDWATLKE